MKMRLFIVLVAAGLSAAGCHDNETSFFIEHAKAQPNPPECVSSASDPWTTGGLLDLALGYEYHAFFLIDNQLVSREDYNNFRAESNGILVDYAKVKVLSASNDLLGEFTVYSDFYLEPESSDIGGATILNGEIGLALAQRYGCLPLNSTNYPESTMFGGGAGVDVNGRPVPRSLESATVKVRFFGYTNGGQEVKTQKGFIFQLSLCCGCLIDWTPCAASCDRYCADPQPGSFCNPGASAGDSMEDCRMFYHDVGASWSDPVNANCEEENDTGVSVPRACTCEDC